MGRELDPNPEHFVVGMDSHREKKSSNHPDTQSNNATRGNERKVAMSVADAIAFVDRSSNLSRDETLVALVEVGSTALREIMGEVGLTRSGKMIEMHKPILDKIHPLGAPASPERRDGRARSPRCGPASAPSWAVTNEDPMQKADPWKLRGASSLEASFTPQFAAAATAAFSPTPREHLDAMGMSPKLEVEMCWLLRPSTISPRSAV